MNLLIVSGSQRTRSQSAKVAEFIALSSPQFSEVFHVELCKYHLPYWDGSDAKLDKDDWTMIAKELAAADALVLITPEWGGMASPLLKNFLLMCDQQHTGHKPALLVSVVSGISGAYPIAELRMNALKNNKIVATPDHLIIREVEAVLNNSGDNYEPKNKRLKERIAYSLHMLHQYSKALLTVRANHSKQPYPKQQEYAYGM